jgi:hypothetical protein
MSDRKGGFARMEDYRPDVRFRLVAFDEIRLSTDRHYLIKNIIPREGLVVIWGEPKCGKSFWTFDAAMHVALSWHYRGHPVQQGLVVYIACEGERGLGARTEAFRRRWLAEDHDAVPFHLITTRLDLVGDVEHLISDIRAQLGEKIPVLVIIDTLNRSIRGSESDDEDMGAYVKAMDTIRETFHCAVAVIHHCGVEGKRPRGHTSLTGAVDAQIAIKRDDTGLITATVEYMKDGPEGKEITSRLEVVEVGTDEDGEAITSCVIVPADHERRATDRVKVTGQAKIALELLRRAIDAAGEPSPGGRHYPTGQIRVVPESLWEAYCKTGSITASDSPDTARKAFRRAAEKLQEFGIVQVWGGFVWITDKPDKSGH